MPPPHGTALTAAPVVLADGMAVTARKGRRKIAAAGGRGGAVAEAAIEDATVQVGPTGLAATDGGFLRGHPHPAATALVDRSPGPSGAADAATHYCTTLAPDPFEIRRILGQIRAQFMPLSGADTVGRLELVLAEILNNIAEHGDPASQHGNDPGSRRSVHLSAATATGGIYCIISDVGEAVPADCLAPRSLPRPPAPEEPTHDLAEGGFGWFMIQNTARKLYYGREGRRNILAFLIPQDGTALAV